MCISIIPWVVWPRSINKFLLGLEANFLSVCDQIVYCALTQNKKMSSWCAIISFLRGDMWTTGYIRETWQCQKCQNHVVKLFPPSLDRNLRGKTSWSNLMSVLQRSNLQLWYPWKVLAPLLKCMTWNGTMAYSIYRLTQTHRTLIYVTVFHNSEA